MQMTVPARLALARGANWLIIPVMPPFAFLAQGTALGLSAAGMPGPLTALLISETLGRGWRRGLWVTLAPLLSDAPIILVTTFLLGQLPDLLLRLIGIVGGLYVLRLAWRLWQAWQQGPTVPDSGASNAGIGLSQAILVNYLSPGPYIFWGLVNGPLLLSAWKQSPTHAGLFLAGFYGAFLGAMAALVGVFHQARRLGPRLVRSLMLASVLLLVAFAAILLWRGLASG